MRTGISIITPARSIGAGVISAPSHVPEIIASNDTSDLRRRDADIAIRHKRPREEALFARRLRDMTGQLYASRQYLDEVGRPSTAVDLAKMCFVGFDAPKQRLGFMASRGVELTTANFNFLTSSVTLSVALIRHGFGIGILPVEIGDAYPELEDPFPTFEPIDIDMDDALTMSAAKDSYLAPCVGRI